jgi:hypothetical protein
LIRKRFPWARRNRIAAWTAFGLAWTTALVARTVGAPAAVVPETAEAPPPGPSVESVAPTATMATVPEPPEDGLVILRYTPAERPEPEVRRVVVTQQAPAPTVTHAPTTQRSSGS